MIDYFDHQADWQPVETAPQDRPILVYAPAHDGLPDLVCCCNWHPDAGLYINELRSVTHWMPLPKPPRR